METDIRSEIELKYKKGRQLLFSRESESLQDLIRLIEKQKHRTLVMWAYDCAKVPLALFEAKYPDELRPRKAMELSEAWARGTIKMPEARRAILDAHKAAKEIENKEYKALVHAIGHASATVHTETHALGLVFYELTAIVIRVGLEKCDSAVKEKISYYYKRLLYWQENIDALNVTWAKFLLDDTRPNKEKMLNEKRTNETDDMKEELIAPCGMNCAICVSYLAKKNDLKKKGFQKSYCEGCLPRGKNCTFLKKQCDLLGKGLVRFCYECKDFPCARLKALDKRYRTKYHMSMIENLEFVKEHGMGKFLEKEEKKWRCPGCGEMICCHNGLCLNCEIGKLQKNKKYRWGEK